MLLAIRKLAYMMSRKEKISLLKLLRNLKNLRAIKQLQGFIFILKMSVEKQKGLSLPKEESWKFQISIKFI